jgi:SAM-dependent methyltransferase
MQYNHPRFLFRKYEVLRLVKESGHFLEIGPGNLNLAQDLLSKFLQGTLIDFNPTDVEKIYNELKDQYKQRLKLIIADFSEYQFDTKFDCVVACEVLEHIENDEMFLQKTNRLLVDDGQLILSVPAKQKYWSKDDEIVGHYRRYEKKDLYNKLLEGGFSQIEILSYGFPFVNIVRLGRILLATNQYAEKNKWDKKKQSQQSAFIIKHRPYMNFLALFLNKYLFYPFSLFAALFNSLDLSEGYVVSAKKVSNDYLSFSHPIVNIG